MLRKLQNVRLSRTMSLALAGAIFARCGLSLSSLRPIRETILANVRDSHGRPGPRLAIKGDIGPGNVQSVTFKRSPRVNATRLHNLAMAAFYRISHGRSVTYGIPGETDEAVRCVGADFGAPLSTMIRPFRAAAHYRNVRAAV